MSTLEAAGFGGFVFFRDSLWCLFPVLVFFSPAQWFLSVVSPQPMYPGRKWGVVDVICVSEIHRNMGLGTELLHKAERWFFKNDVECIVCRVGVHNPALRYYWKMHGYVGYIEVFVEEL